MDESMKRFMLNNAVASKMAGMPLVGTYAGRKYVFIHGYPLSLKGFYMLTSKAVFGSTVRLPGRRWAELHAETRLLCEGLSLELKEDREAFSVVKGIAQAMNWNEKTVVDKTIVVKWIEEVEEKLNRVGE